MGIQEKMKKIEDDLHKTQVNKKTEHHVGLLRAKLAKLKRDAEEAKSRGGASSLGFDVKKSGDATVVLIGLPSVGKSTLLNNLTNAKSRVAAYKFTTLTVVPGVLDYMGARIQILDLPGIIQGASSGKGLGKRVLSVARSADLVLFMLDVFQPEAFPLLVNEIKSIGVRPGERPPNVIIEKTSNGGVSVASQVKMTKMNEELVKDILRVYDIHHARVIVREDISDEQLIDVLIGTRTYPRSLVVMNKIDLVNAGFINEIRGRTGVDFVPISADAGINVEALKEKLFHKLDFIRIFMRPKGRETDYEEPMIVRNGSLILDICNKVHRDLKDEFRYAQVWGTSAKFPGQRVGISHCLKDGDVLTVISK